MIDDNTFRNVVSKAIERLPDHFRKVMDNIEVVVEDFPSPKDEEHFHCRNRGCLLLGLYRGVPITKRGTRYGNLAPDKISLFRGNIAKLCRSDNEMVAQIHRTLLHEIGHYFGLSDVELRALGF